MSRSASVISLTGAAVCLALLLGTAPASASDRSLNISSLAHPSVDGERELRMRIRRSGVAPDHQRPIQSRPRAGETRVVLEYVIGNQNFNRATRLIPELKPSSGGFLRASAILPQGQFIHVRPQDLNKRHLNPVYVERPIKIAHGQRVRYRWVLESRNGTQRGDVHEFTMPHPLVFALTGDSYGSGEGAPNAGGPFLFQVEWDQKDAHRSKRSGQKRAALEFRSRHPQLWMEFKHVGISGATLTRGSCDSGTPSGGLTGDYCSDRDLKLPSAVITGVPIPLPMNPNAQVEGQIEQLENWMARESFARMHLMTVSIGGNDAGFGHTIASAIYGALSFDFANQHEAFRDRLEDFAEQVEEDFIPSIDMVLRPMHLQWTNYPDMTTNEDGEVTGLHMDFTFNDSLALYDLLVGRDDLLNARFLLSQNLNPAVAAACATVTAMSAHTTCTLGDVEDAAIGHGLGAPQNQRWFNTFQDAQDEVQGAIDGVVHPNARGQQIYRNVTLTEMERLFHPTRGLEMRRMRQEARNAAREAAKERAKAKAVAQAQREQARRKAQARQPVATNKISRQRISKITRRGVADRAAVTRQDVARADSRRRALAQRATPAVARIGVDFSNPGLLRANPVDQTRLQALRTRLQAEGDRARLAAFEKTLKSLAKPRRVTPQEIERATQAERRRVSREVQSARAAANRTGR